MSFLRLSILLLAFLLSHTVYASYEEEKTNLLLSEKISIWTEESKYYDSLSNFPDLEIIGLLENRLSTINTNDAPFRWMCRKIILGQAYASQKSYTEAFSHLDEIALFSKNRNDKYAQALVYQAKATIYQSVYQYTPATENYYQAAFLFDELGITKEAVNSYYRAIQFQYNAGNYLNVFPTVDRVIELYNNEKNKDLQLVNRIKQIYNATALSHTALQAYDMAMQYYDLAYQIADSLDQEFWKALIKGNIGNLYVKKGEYDKAEAPLIEDLKISKKSERWSSATNAAIILGQLYMELDQPRLAKAYLDSANMLIEDKELLFSRPNLYQNYSKYYSSIQDYKTAFSYNQLYIQYQDSIKNLLKEQELDEIKTRLDFERAKEEIDLLRKNNDLQRKQFIQTLIITIASIIIALLLGIIGFTSYFNLKKERKINLRLDEMVKSRTKDLELKNKELDTYLYRASHDVRRPIASIMGLVQLFDKEKLNEKNLDLLEKLRQTALNMDNMLHKLHYLHHVDKLDEVHQVTLISIFTICLQSLQPIILAKNIAILSKIPEKLEITTIPELLHIAIKCVIENAIQFTNKFNQEHQLEIDVKKVGSQIKILIRDNGIGIKMNGKQGQDLFKAYNKLHDHSEGSGLGLHIAYKALERLKGEISIDSIYGKGTSVLITVPTKL